MVNETRCNPGHVTMKVITYHAMHNMFEEDIGEDIKGHTRCVTDYIMFCEESVVTTRNVPCFPNNKQWINGDIKVLLIRKKALFAGDNVNAKNGIKKNEEGIAEGHRSNRGK